MPPPTLNSEEPHKQAPQRSPSASSDRPSNDSESEQPSYPCSPALRSPWNTKTSEPQQPSINRRILIREHIKHNDHRGLSRSEPPIDHIHRDLGSILPRVAKNAR